MCVGVLESWDCKERDYTVIEASAADNMEQWAKKRNFTKNWLYASKIDATKIIYILFLPS